MKKIFVMLLLIISIILSSCGNTEYDNFSYEDVEMVITKMDTNYFFAGTHHYIWDIEVYYKPYDLYYDEVSESTGAFGAPSFFNANEGDIINARIRNNYSNGELINREVIYLW